jgi:hypothetical protein
LAAEVRRPIAMPTTHAPCADPIIDGYVDCVVIRPDGSRKLARAMPGPAAQ